MFILSDGKVPQPNETTLILSRIYFGRLVITFRFGFFCFCWLYPPYALLGATLSVSSSSLSLFCFIWVSSCLRCALCSSLKTISSNGSIFLCFYSSCSLINYSEVISTLSPPSLSVRYMKIILASSGNILTAKPSRPRLQSYNETPSLCLKSR